MGLLDIFRRKDKRPGGSLVSPEVAGAGFAVVDVETTGLSPSGHRVLELAIVRVDPVGTVVDEWVSRFNPEGPVGATHIHGITAADVAGAPRFAELTPEITRRLAGYAVAGHNVRFDLGFLRAEYTRAGWALPFLPSTCTLQQSFEHLPRLDRRRLADCCSAMGIRLDGAHSALGDARATAALLGKYLNGRTGYPPSQELLGLPRQGSAVPWPSAPGGPRLPEDHVRQRISLDIAKLAAAPLVELLQRASLGDALDDGAPEGSLPYLELLAEVLEDGVLTDDERAALRDLAGLYDLDDSGVAAAHRGFLLSLAHLALDDGRVSRAEKAELTTVAGLLGVAQAELTAVLDDAEAARVSRLSADLKPLPSDWHHGEPLRVNDKVAFTGCDDTQRARLEQRAERLGVRVMNNVSRRTTLLVTDGGFSGGKAENAKQYGTRRVHPDQFDLLLTHLQPAAARREPTGLEPGTISPESVRATAATIRAWAQLNGYTVSERGRLPLDVTTAYRHAHTDASPN
ncbi:exonuclease domain-containing protein [Actinokineospora globicatena]|uniref:Exonuclease domain-containing protein n=1 Tax=Actinokineospora globicatena TaxID=103729 RepID=A0A9W6V8X4_9PSEU|nr:histone-like nucleoid-structuring protein Lsr2 [Actinokineospora globicatena]GLW90426.1 hypothetical protein Aglo03_12420 [Actinokineospora globicatena]